MVIDTTSREGMEKALSSLMRVSVSELYQYIDAAADLAVKDQGCFYQDIFDRTMEDFYSDMIEDMIPDEILFFIYLEDSMGMKKKPPIICESFSRQKIVFLSF